MPPVINWNTAEDWELWKNDSSSGEVRIVDDTLKLPFQTIRHIGTGSSSQVVARWRFGQNQNANDATANGHTAALANGFDIEIDEEGLLSPTRSGFATVNEDGDFGFGQLSANSFYMSCWIKSNRTDYPTIAFIAGEHVGLGNGEIAYAFMVDTDNKLKVFTLDGSGNTEKISPVGGDITIDTQWHHLLFWANVETGSVYNRQFVIDNDFGNESVDQDTIITTLSNAQFDISSSSFSTTNGFSGIIDELVVGEWTGTSPSITLIQKRFENNTYISPVLDTERDNSILSIFSAEFEDPNNSLVLFSFRASNTPFEMDDYSIEWTGFTTKGQILSGEEKNLDELGLFVIGRFHQVRIQLIPSTDHLSSDPLQTITPILKSVELNTAVASHYLIPSNSAFNSGQIIGQIAQFSGSKTIHKVTLNLNVSDKDKKLFIIASQGNASFHAVNFQSYRDSWVFQPAFHWSESTWKTSGLTIENSLQTDFYGDPDDAFVNAPFISYFVFLDNPGEYDIWGYGFVSSPGLFWAFDNDETHLRSFTLGEDTSSGFRVPRWTKIGRILSIAGGLHTFTVYLGNVDSVLLDQWYFTQNLNFDIDLENLSEDGFNSPIPISRSPYITAMRLRPLSGDNVSTLESNPGITSWIPSNEIIASGQVHYPIQNNASSLGVTFADGASIEFWQVGGSLDDYAAWNYNFDDTSAGNSFKSTDYGQNYEFEP
jgi:hypothetical protein